MRLIALLGCAMIAAVVPGHAQPVVWELVNEYPATALAGEADLFFAEAVKRNTGGKILIRPIHDAKSGLRTRDQLKAVAEGRFAMANSYSGALADESPAFLISSLPFVTASARDALALYVAARPLYETLLAERGHKLLYVSPWPPSGIWSAAPVVSITALKALRIRTYDKTGTEVFAQVAASAKVVTFSDLNAMLEAGQLNAVLSSGDGGAGRQFWKYLRNFSEIVYALPLSFGTVSLDVWAALDEPTRAAILAAGEETTAHQWAAMSGRIAQNFARMRENNVVIDEHPPAEVLAALRSAAATSIAAWEGHAGPDARRVVEEFRARPSP